MLKQAVRVLSLLLTAGLLGACTAAPEPGLPDIRIIDTHVYPENLDADSTGMVYVGSVKGNVYRARPGSAFARPWIRHDDENGILTILGVRVDEATRTLWLCSVPNFFGPERSEGVSSLISFDLDSGDFRARYPLPPPASVCNDITFSASGTVYLTDTSNGRLFTLAPGEQRLKLFGEDQSLVGVDGIAFSADGTLYVNNVRTHEIVRVDIAADGSMGRLTSLNLSHELGGPDGFRLIEGNRFIQAEGTIGRLGIITIDGDDAVLDVLRDDLVSTPGATVVGNTAYVIESNIGYLLDPALAGQEPPPFMIYAVPLP